MFQFNNTVFRMFRQERKLFKLLKNALNKKDKTTIIVSYSFQIDAFELWAKQLGKEAVRPYDKYIIIDNKILIATADCNSHYPAKQVYVLADVLKASSERGKRSQEIYCV